MTSSASDKRWAIMPPPPTSPLDEGELEVGAESSIRKKRERLTEPVPQSREAGPSYAGEMVISQVRELDPDNCLDGDSSTRDRITEVPDTVRNRFSDPDFETIPAPAWIEHDN